MVRVGQRKVKDDEFRLLMSDGLLECPRARRDGFRTLVVGVSADGIGGITDSTGPTIRDFFFLYVRSIHVWICTGDRLDRQTPRRTAHSSEGSRE